jgi:NitT/TauT family transport system substrate-binding protein
MTQRASRLFVAFLLSFSTAALADEVPRKFHVCWSHYTGWEPWGYADASGILKKWAAKNGIEVEITRVDDYMDSIAQYSAGTYDGCAMTNMDALALPAAGGIDSTAIIVGDFSNGNDGILLKNGATVADLKGREVHLVALSVSHYLLTRAMTGAHLTDPDVKIANATEEELETSFDKGATAVVTWNPILRRLRSTPATTMVFDSSRVPGEIIDLMVVHTNAPDSLKKTLAGAWYEVMTQMSSGKKKARQELLDSLAKGAGGSRADFDAQLATTAMFYKPAEAARFSRDMKLRATMEYVRTFSFEHGLYGEGAKSKDVVGIMFPDGSMMGDEKNVKLRFDDRYMAAAAAGRK